mgnify:FL=1
MSKGKKAATAAVIILIAAVVAVAAWYYFGNAGKSAEPESETVSESISDTQTNTPSVPESETQTTSESTTQSTTAGTTRKDTTVQVTGYMLPLTVREAMDALQMHYGSAYEINSTVEENGLNYFSVNLNGERFASVAVDLVTGRAEETIRETGEKTDFSLV